MPRSMPIACPVPRRRTLTPQAFDHLSADGRPKRNHGVLESTPTAQSSTKLDREPHTLKRRTALSLFVSGVSRPPDEMTLVAVCVQGAHALNKLPDPGGARFASPGDFPAGSTARRIHLQPPPALKQRASARSMWKGHRHHPGFVFPGPARAPTRANFGPRLHRGYN